MIEWQHDWDWYAAQRINDANQASAGILSCVEAGAYLNVDPLRLLEKTIADLATARNLFIARRNEWDNASKPDV